MSAGEHLLNNSIGPVGNSLPIGADRAAAVRTTALVHSAVHSFFDSRSA